MELIVTVVMFLILIFGIKKKIDLPTLMLGISIVALSYLTIVGGSVMGEDSSGNVIIDIFEFISKYMTTSIGGTVLIVMVVISYVEVMNKIKASDMLAAMIGEPIKNIRKPYLLAAFALILGGFLKVAITIGPAAAALMIAMIFPVLIKGKCSVLTAATAMVVGASISWGPADSTCYTALSLMGLEGTNMTDWFVQMQIPLVLTTLIIAAIVFVITAKRFDKRELATVTAEVSNQLMSGELNVPQIYGLLPLLPVLLLFVFSPILIKSVTISIIAAILISMLITLIVHAIASKNNKALTELMADFYASLGNTFKGLGVLIMFAMLFATCLNKIGGMKMIADALAGLSVPPFVLVFVIVAFSGIMTMIVGSFFGALSICAPLAASIAGLTGLNPLLLCYLVVLACGIGAICSPVNPVVVVVATECKVDILQLIKRTAPAAWCGLIGATILGLILFGQLNHSRFSV